MVLWGLHYLTGLVFMPGTVPSALISLLLLLFTIFYSAKAICKIQFPSYIKAFWNFGCMLLCYGVILMISGKVIATAAHISDYTFTGLTFVRNILNSIFPIFVFYYFFNKGYVNQKTFQIWVVILFCIAAIFYFHKRVNMLAVLESLVVQRDGFTNNTAYAITAFLPLIFYLSNKRIIQLAAFGFCLFMIFMGVKRGAILISMIIFAYYSFTSFKKLRRKYKIGFFILLTLFSYIAYIVFLGNFATDSYFLDRLAQTQNGDVNGRDHIFSKLLKAYFYDYNFFEVIFGRGAYGTLKTIGQFAHNDWIEILLSHGLLGIILYALFFIRFISFIQKKRNKSTVWFSLVMVFIIISMRTLFSMSYNEFDIWLSLALAYNTFKLNYPDEFIDSNTQLSYET